MKKYIRLICLVCCVFLVTGLVTSCSTTPKTDKESATKDNEPAPSFIPVETPTISISKIFSDYIVLQQNSPVKIWGTGVNNKAVVTVTVADKTATAQVIDGKWEAIIDPVVGGMTEYEMTISANDTTNILKISKVMFGEVWICAGQSNMNILLGGVTGGAAEVSKASNPSIRMYRCAMPTGLTDSDNPENKYNSEWIPDDKTISKTDKINMYSATAYFYAKSLQESLNVPVGVIVMACGNTLAHSWISKDAMLANEEIKSFASITTGIKNNQSGIFYDSLKEQVIPYTSKGVLWYQGESNAPAGGELESKYSVFLETLIKGWRADWKEENKPFIIVQLPKMPTKPIPWGTAEQWESIKTAQAKVTSTVANTFLVKTDDIDKDTDLHPLHKKILGKRAADIVISNVYNK